mgnify:CR=1 FL=1|tara:strand:+ start:322 stop:981 length:660 start_codon:yes stop_codon:yes gene_type:complete
MSEPATTAARVEPFALPFAPYYSDERCTIYNNDCRKVLPWLPAFDLLLTDPPYGIDAGNMNLGFSASSRIEGSEWDSARPPRGTIEGAIDACTQAIVWGGNYFDLGPSRNVLVWDKTPEMQGRSFAECEVAWCSWDAVARLYRYAPKQMKKVHKTQKPLPLMQWSLGLVPAAGTVLDPFMGSGTTLVAAKLEGRHAVGIEISERYCEIAADRLRQGVLF